VYYWDWDFEEIINLSPQNRILTFIKKRKELLCQLELSGIKVDPTVTVDPYRLMKIPKHSSWEDGVNCSTHT